MVKNRFHICINNNSDNTPSSNASLSDSKLSVDKDGLVNIPGSLVVNNTNSMTAITDLQNSNAGVDSSTALHVASVKTAGAISSSSSANQVEIGRAGNSAIVRISSSYASFRLESVGQSQNFTRFTISRNAITQSTFVLLGTVQYQSWASGSNTFHG